MASPAPLHASLFSAAAVTKKGRVKRENQRSNVFPTPPGHKRLCDMNSAEKVEMTLGKNLQ